jgi:hypothetical protein
MSAHDRFQHLTVGNGSHCRPALLLTRAAISPARANTDEDGRYWLSMYAQGKLPVENVYWSMDVHPRWREEGEQFDQLILRPAVFLLSP